MQRGDGKGGSPQRATIAVAHMHFRLPPSRKDRLGARTMVVSAGEHPIRGSVCVLQVAINHLKETIPSLYYEVVHVVQQSPFQFSLIHSPIRLVGPAQHVILAVLAPAELERNNDPLQDEVDEDNVHLIRLALFGEADLRLDAVGDLVKCNGGVFRIVAVGADVVLCGVAANEVRLLGLVVIVTVGKRLLVVGGCVAEFQAAGFAVRLCALLLRLEHDHVVLGVHHLGYVHKSDVARARRLLENLAGLVEEVDDALGDGVGHVGDVLEGAREGGDDVGAVLCEGALEDVEAEAARVDDGQARHVFPVVLVDHVREDLRLEPGEDAVVAGVGGAVDPQVLGRAAVLVVQVEGLAGFGDELADVLAVLCREGRLVEAGVVVEAQQIVVDETDAAASSETSSADFDFFLTLLTDIHPMVSPYRPLAMAYASLSKESASRTWAWPPKKAMGANQASLRRAANVADDDKEVGLLLAQHRLEPFLLDRVLDRLDDRVVCIAREVEEEAESDNVEPLILRLELTVALGLRDSVARFWVDVVEVTRNVVFSVIRHRDVVLALGSVGLVELVIARADDVDGLLLEDVVGEEAFRGGGVVEAVALYAVARVDDEEVDTLLVGLAAHVLGKGDIVTPVGRVLWFEEVAAEPAVDVGGVEEVDLAPS
ncbi:hypothetical protein JMJ77_0005898 [Colletotrichum scovillei]|uniref:Uncharacterized protein n=1 Tax=Colletotrichum scovillei TaxID=1209932 RepID=A0A9P7UHV2_9PEZI|nr:hypothetical protein JMJ77_0005898 [Colletotrichum scovillei]KAG7077126.1 hypothetical protein JMJ76_0014378 [Colletotrichum scovillei]KAG7084270.1 hypothetical protein JMJ78_0009707 [Colletotrichum scovillei]